MTRADQSWTDADKEEVGEELDKGWTRGEDEQVDEEKG